MTFREEVSRLKAARNLVKQFGQEVDSSYEEWRVQNESKIASLEQAKMDLTEIEDHLRACIVSRYQNTGDKHPHPKLGVRVSEVPVYDADTATRFAFNTVPELLALDKRAFESYAKGVKKSAPLQFVTWEEKVIATIARDLDG